MRFLIVPHRVERTQAYLWVGVWTAGGAPGASALTLDPGNQTVPLPAAAWRPVNAGGVIPDAKAFLYIQQAHLPGLPLGTRHEIRAPDGFVSRFATLPQTLPTDASSPLNLLLSSCFFEPNDRSGAVGQAVFDLPAPYFPHLKILCGDQVYLDQPTLENVPSDPLPMAQLFQEKYARTWFQGWPSSGAGYRNLLAKGGASFTSDDHEFWNNFPNWGTLIPTSWSNKGRENWRKAALALFREFQKLPGSPVGAPEQFQIGTLSFFIVDTRIYRSEGEARFMRPSDFNALRNWIAGLQGPGVLVLGQPLFDKPNPWITRKLGDRSLADYDQYRDLLGALFASRYSILLLTGDVHFGRVAKCTLRMKPGPIPVEMYEVIASPSSLVSALVGGEAHDPPPNFPAKAGGFPPAPITRIYKTAKSHFATLQLWQRPGGVSVSVRYWFPADRIGRDVSSETVPTFSLR